MKMTKHPGKQNYKARGKNKMTEHILFMIFTQKNVLSICEFPEVKSPFYHVKRTMCNRNLYKI